MTANNDSNSEFINVSINNKKRHFKIQDISTFHNMSEIKCFFCNRSEKELGNEEHLEKEHIIQLVEGGEDRLENLQILCTACHKLKNWMIYFVKFRTLKPGYYKFVQEHPDLIEKWNNKNINLYDFLGESRDEQ